MTIDEVIDRADELKPNGYDREMKRGWVQAMEDKIVRYIIETHDVNDTDGDGRDDDLPNEGELCASGVTDGAVYVWWLLAQIDYANGDIVRYNNDSALFNTYYDDFAAYWNRTHRAKRAPKIKY